MPEAWPIVPAHSAAFVGVPEEWHLSKQGRKTGPVLRCLR